MDLTLGTALIAGASGLISGVLGSLIAPWVHWGVEKKRALNEARRALLKEAREYVGSNLFSGRTFDSKTIYRRLKPYLGSIVVEAAENYEEVQDRQDDPGEFPAAFRREVLDELGRLEKEWGLI